MKQITGANYHSKDFSFIIPKIMVVWNVQLVESCSRMVDSITLQVISIFFVYGGFCILWNGLNTVVYWPSYFVFSSLFPIYVVLIYYNIKSCCSKRKQFHRHWIPSNGSNADDTGPHPRDCVHYGLDAECVHVYYPTWCNVLCSRFRSFSGMKHNYVFQLFTIPWLTF